MNQQYSTWMTRPLPGPGSFPVIQDAGPSYTFPTVVSNIANAPISQGNQGNELGLQKDISGTAQVNPENMPSQQSYNPMPATPGFTNYSSNQETQSVRPSNTLGSISQGNRGNELGLQKDITGTAQANPENMPSQQSYNPMPATPGFTNYSSNQETQSVRPSNTLDDDTEANFEGQPAAQLGEPDLEDLLAKMPDPELWSGSGIHDEPTTATAPAAQPFQESAAALDFDEWGVNESEDIFGGLFDELTGDGDN